MISPYLMPYASHLAISGGKTSGYMLRMILDAHGGKLPVGVLPIFCNTGKEASGTLDFVHRMETEWDCPILWLEFISRAKLGIRVVTYETASRNGEPFQALIRTKQRLPNVVSRFCTQWLKILTAYRYCRWVMRWEAFTTALGLRADEPHRVAKLAWNEETPCEETIAPLHTAGVTKGMILEWWKAQPFGLDIDEDAGNCDLCFLKGVGQRTRLIGKQPGVADWWSEQERWVTEKTGSDGSKFDKRFSLQMLVDNQDLLSASRDERFPDCRCTD